MERQRFVNSQIDAVAGDGVQIIDPAKVLCDDSQCHISAENHSLYRDDDHLSPFGATWVTSAFDGLINQTRLLPPSTAFTVERNVRYADDENPNHLMTVYTPSGQGPFPALVAIHGGNWSGGGRDEGVFQEEVTHYANRGIAVFSVDYQLSSPGQASWPANIQDVVCALRHIRVNAGEYNIDPRRIGAIGDSAGGHLASLLGTIDGHEDFVSEACGDPAVSLDLSIVVSYSGPGNLSAFGTAEGLNIVEAAEQMLGGGYRLALDAWRLASPSTHADPKDPPFVISHAISDELIPFESSSFFVEALRAAGVPVTFATVEGDGHGVGLRLTMRVASEPEIERLLLAN